MLGVCGYRRRPRGGILSLCETAERLRGLENVTRTCIQIGEISVLGELCLLKESAKVTTERCMWATLK